MNLSDFLIFIQPYTKFLLFILVIISFARSIPLLGLFLSRFPVFLIVCISASNIFHLMIAILLSFIPELLGDIVNYYKLNEFWSIHLYRANTPFVEPKIASLMKRYKSKPIISTLIVSYTVFNFSLVAPLARKYNLGKLFWYPRIIIGFINTCFFASIYYIIGYNIKVLESFLGNFAKVIFLIIILIILFNIYKSYKIIKKYFFRDSK